jgi:hypothetical protein
MISYREWRLIFISLIISAIVTLFGYYLSSWRLPYLSEIRGYISFTILLTPLTYALIKLYLFERRR